MGVLAFLAFAYIAYKLIEEKWKDSHSKQYWGTDWDAYYRDIENGMDMKTHLKKVKRGDYWITTPPSKNKK